MNKTFWSQLLCWLAMNWIKHKKVLFSIHFHIAANWLLYCNCVEGLIIIRHIYHIYKCDKCHFMSIISILTNPSTYIYSFKGLKLKLIAIVCGQLICLNWTLSYPSLIFSSKRLVADGLVPQSWWFDLKYSSMVIWSWIFYLKYPIMVICP